MDTFNRLLFVVVMTVITVLALMSVATKKIDEALKAEQINDSLIIDLDKYGHFNNK